jgi:hypothetical protein
VDLNPVARCTKAVFHHQNFQGRREIVTIRFWERQ